MRCEQVKFCEAIREVMLWISLTVYKYVRTYVLS